MQPHPALRRRSSPSIRESESSARRTHARSRTCCLVSLDRYARSYSQVVYQKMNMVSRREQDYSATPAAGIAHQPHPTRRESLRLHTHRTSFACTLSSLSPSSKSTLPKHRQRHGSTVTLIQKENTHPCTLQKITGNATGYSSPLYW